MPNVDLKAGSFSANDTNGGIMAWKVVFNVDTTINGVWIYNNGTSVSSTASVTYRAWIYTAAGAMQAQGSDSVTSTPGWVYLPLSSPLTLTGNTTWYIGASVISFPSGSLLRGMYQAGSAVSNTAGGTNFTVSSEYRTSSGLFTYNGYCGVVGVSASVPNTAPNAATITSPAANANLNTRTPTITWAFSDPDPGDTQSAYYVYIRNSDDTGTLWTSGWITGSATSYVIPSGAITADGTYNVRVYTKDQAGAQSPRSDPVLFISDTVAPTIGTPSPQQYVRGGSGTSVSVDGITDTGSGINRVQVYQVRPDGSYFDIGNAFASGGNQYSMNVSGMNVDGTWGFDFRAYDNAGNVSNGGNPVRALVVRDSILPADPNEQVTYQTTTASITWNAFSDAAPSSGHNETWIDIQSWNGTAWTSLATYPKSLTPKTVTSYSITGLAQGAQYRAKVWFTDNSGNTSPSSYTAFTTKKRIGTYRVEGKTAPIDIPVYDPASGVVGSKALRIQVTAGIGCFELVEITDPNASPWRVQTPHGIKSISK